MHFTYSSLESPWSISYFMMIEHFSEALIRLRRYEGKSVEVGVFRRGWVTLNANFMWKGTSSINHCWCQKTRTITLSCGMKIPVIPSFVLSHTCDRRTDRRTYLRQPYRANMRCMRRAVRSAQLCVSLSHLSKVYLLLYTSVLPSVHEELSSLSFYACQYVKGDMQRYITKFMKSGF